MTNFCEKCRAEHPGRECDYDPKTGLCAETRDEQKEHSRKEDNQRTLANYIRNQGR